MIKVMKKRGFTDKMFILLTIMMIIVFLASLALMFMNSDSSPLAYLIPSFSTLYTVFASFQLKKTEKENLAKISRGEAQYIPVTGNIDELAGAITNSINQ